MPTRSRSSRISSSSCRSLSQSGSPLAPVELAQAERRELVEELSLTGTLTSPQTASLATEVEGRVDFDNVTVKRYDHGMTAISVPLPDAQITRLRAAKAARAKDFAPLAIGISLSAPSSVSVLIHAALALPGT